MWIRFALLVTKKLTFKRIEYHIQCFLANVLGCLSLLATGESWPISGDQISSWSHPKSRNNEKWINRTSHKRRAIKRIDFNQQSHQGLLLFIALLVAFFPFFRIVEEPDTIDWTWRRATDCIFTEDRLKKKLRLYIKNKIILLL